MHYKTKYRAKKQFNIDEITPEIEKALMILRFVVPKALEIVLAYLQNEEISGTGDGQESEDWLKTEETFCAESLNIQTTPDEQEEQDRLLAILDSF
jgi:hypothetical protein